MSRTSSASHQRFSKRVLADGEASGVTHCPCIEPCRHHDGRPCGVELDYRVSRQPESAEPDHILPVYYGGTDTVENGRVICRRCNQSRGKGDRAKRKAPKPVIASPIW